MKKRLLAVLLACCMAAGMANAVFAADELPATAESAAAIAPADPDPPAPEPEIEAEPTPAAAPAATPETARTLVMETLLAAPDTAAQTAVVTSAELVDSIRTDGCFTAKVNGSTDRLDGAVYTWYRSKDGTNWEEVPQQLCSGDAWNITPGSEHRLNAALDACIAGVRDAERLYYKVEVTGTDGAKLTAAAMQVPYCIQLQNGSFETPDIAGLKAYHNKDNNTPASRLYYSRDGETGTFFTQYPSGEGGIVWQTTGVARHWKTGSAGLYIELADGSNRSYNGTRNYPEASYSIDGAYDGRQFAELNCEAYGALYQDVLTAPGTTLHWSLAHRARGRGMQDSMALLIAPVDVAAQITDILAGASSEDDNRGLLVRAALDRTVQYNGEEVPIRSFMVGGEITDGNDQWGVHSGDYTVRAGQYVSRFFFLALSSGKGDRREGNLLDKVWFSTEPAPPVAGHANLTLRKTLAGSLTADESDLPDDGEKNYVGSVDQLDGSDIIATFAADDSGIANKESDVSVGFDTSKFEAPGIYYYHLTERDPGIHGLTATTATYLLKVRVVNDNTSDPDGATFKIDYATLTSLDDNTKSDLITNTYTTHGLTVTKALAGDWADYTDHFIFTLEITDPDADPSRMASVTVQTTSAAGVTSGAEVKPFTNGKVSFSETIRGGDVIEVTGLPTGAAYTITESGLDAEKYTTAWTLDGETLSTERALPTQTVGAADTALTVTNTRSSIAPTGLLLDAAPYGAMLALAAGSGLVFFRKRRRED